MTYLENTTAIFNATLDNEFNVRLMGEHDLKADLVISIVGLSKTTRLSTLFTKSGLENIVETLEKKKNLLGFLIDLTDVFSFNICSAIGDNAETDLIKLFGKCFSYKSEKNLCLFGDSFSDNYSTDVEIITTIKNNRWLISIIMFRFLNFSLIEKVEKQPSQIKQK